MIPLAPTPVNALPWAQLIHTTDGPGVRELPLNWPIAIGAMGGVIGFMCLLGIMAMAFSTGDSTPQQVTTIRIASITGLIASAAVILGCIWWQRKKYPRLGALADLLAELFPARAIYQYRSIQLAAVATQIGLGVRFMLAAENLCEGPLSFECDLHGIGKIPGLASQLEGGEVATFHVDLAIPSDRLLDPVQFTMTCRVKSRQGRTVRHYPRIALQSRTTKDAVKLALVLGGHFSWDSQSRFRQRIQFMNKLGEVDLLLQRQVVAEAPALPVTEGWTKVPLGAARDLSTLRDAVKHINWCLGIP